MSERLQFNWSGWLSFGGLLLLWELAARGASGLRTYLPPISQVLVALFASVSTGQVLSHLAITVVRFAESYLLAAAIGVTLGVVLGYSRFLHDLLEMPIEFLRPMPSVAIVPVAILMLGIGDSMIVAVTVYATLWPVLINTIDGVNQIESVLIHTGRTFGIGRLRLLRQVILPAAAPYVVTGLRIGLSIALILVTTAEMLAGSKGLGFFILDEERSMNSANMYAGILLVAALGYTLNRLFLIFEAKTIKRRRGASTQQAA